MTIPAFGDPVLRACSGCGASNYLRRWLQRCTECGGYVVNLLDLEALDRGVTVRVEE